MRLGPITLFLSLLLAPCVLPSMEIFPLDAVEPGMRAQWTTRVEGNAMGTFELEIIGRVPDYLGPGKDALLAKGLDADHILSGPVAGMSGSPVTIDGQLVGAYAFGYLWPKEQAIIGITPAAFMLEILESGKLAHRTPAEGGLLTPLPTPLMASGFSQGTLDLFADQWAELGLTLQAGGGSGGNIRSAGESAFDPGGALCAVLMYGDLTMGATGTVTWREDDALLAFGHPFLQWGSIEMPFAEAEVMTIIRNLRSSFKFSKFGEPVGTLFADRLSGVAGKIGVVPEMTRLTFRRTASGELLAPDLSVQLFHHKDMTPLLAATAVAEGLSSTLENERERFVQVEAAIGFRREGGIPSSDEELLEINLVGSGPGAAASLSLDLLDRLNALVEVGDEPVRLTSLNLTSREQGGDRRAVLHALDLPRQRVRSGETLSLTVHLKNSEAGMAPSLEVPLTLPQGLQPGNDLRLVICDAMERSRLLGLDGAWEGGLDARLDSLREDVSPDGFAVLLLQSAPGLASAEVSMEALPSSLRRELAGRDDLITTNERVLSKTWIPLDALVSGNLQRNLTVIKSMPTP
jgi:hypothetical protein